MSEEKTADKEKSAPKAKKASARGGEPVIQDPAPTELTGDYEVYRPRGYVYAKPLPVEEEGAAPTYSVNGVNADDDKFYVWDAAAFDEKYIHVPPSKLDSSEAGWYENRNQVLSELQEAQKAGKKGK